MKDLRNWNKENDKKFESNFTESSDVQNAVQFNLRKIKGFYGNSQNLGLSPRDKRYWTVQSRSSIDQLLRQAYEEPYKMAGVAKALQALDPNYAKIISYFSDMFHIRYTVIPTSMQYDSNETIDEAQYLTSYHEMLKIYDNMNLEILIPDLLAELYLSGSVYVYADKYKPASTVNVLTLPQQYCRPLVKTVQGTYIIQFDFKFFDNITKVEERELVLSYFPREFTTLYAQYLSDGVNWRQLNPKVASAFMLNSIGISPYITGLGDIIDYKEYKTNELAKSRNQLKTILTHQIPVNDNGEVVFTLREVEEIHNSISAVVNENEGMETITVFGKTEMLKIQDDETKENKQVGQAYKNIYNTAGINPEMVIGDSKEALATSFNIDKAAVIKHLNTIEQFLNVAVNNLYNTFKPYEAALKLLYITIQDETEDIAKYREGAKFGIGKLEAIVATGVKQRNLTDVKRLEDMLKLNELLQPLQSSHTQTGDSNMAVEPSSIDTNNDDDDDTSNNDD